MPSNRAGGATASSQGKGWPSLVRTLERRKARELAPGAIQGMAGKDGWLPMRRRATRS